MALRSFLSFPIAILLLLTAGVLFPSQRQSGDQVDSAQLPGTSSTPLGSDDLQVGLVTAELDTDHGAAGQGEGVEPFVVRVLTEGGV